MINVKWVHEVNNASKVKAIAMLGIPDQNLELLVKVVQGKNGLFVTAPSSYIEDLEDGPYVQNWKWDSEFDKAFFDRAKAAVWEHLPEHLTKKNEPEEEPPF